MNINISIVIPNFNGAKFIATCLESLEAAFRECPNTKFEIIIVDNGSTDDSLNLIQKYRVIKNKTNLGFAAAVNQGINKAKYEHVCVINNDLTVDKKWFSLITKTIIYYPNAATFCGTVLNYDGSKIESQGFFYYMSGKCENINNGQRYLAIKNSKLKTYPVWGSSAAIVIYKKSIIQHIGLFDESFFAYIEDVDLSFRLAKNHHVCLLTPKAISYHLGGKTSSSMGNLRAKYTLINWTKLILKNYTITEIIMNFPGILVERLRNLSYYLRSSFIIKTL